MEKIDMSVIGKFFAQDNPLPLFVNYVRKFDNIGPRAEIHLSQPRPRTLNGSFVT